MGECKILSHSAKNSLAVSDKTKHSFSKQSNNCTLGTFSTENVKHVYTETILKCSKQFIVALFIIVKHKHFPNISPSADKCLAKSTLAHPYHRVTFSHKEE